MTSAKNDLHRNLNFHTKHKFYNFVYLLCNILSDKTKNWLILSPSPFNHPHLTEFWPIFSCRSQRHAHRRGHHKWIAPNSASDYTTF